MRPMNRYERGAVAVAVAMPLWWVLLLTAIAAPADLLAILIAAGTRLLTADGKRKLKSGKRRISNGSNNNCCCCPVCTNCTDSVPAAFIISVTGTTPCTGCLACAGPPILNASFKNASSSDVDGTYTVTCAATSCSWTAIYTGAGTFERYSGTACGGSPTTSTQLEINLNKTAPGGTKTFELFINSSMGGSGRHFHGTTAVDTCAVGGYSVTNTQTACAPPVANCDFLNINGTADFDPA